MVNRAKLNKQLDITFDFRRNPRGVVDKVRDSSLEVSELKQLPFHFGQMTLGKVWTFNKRRYAI